MLYLVPRPFPSCPAIKELQVTGAGAVLSGNATDSNASASPYWTLVVSCVHISECLGRL